MPHNGQKKQLILLRNDKDSIMKSSSLLKYVIILLLMLGGCNADFQSKRWAQSNRKGKPAITVVKGFLDLGFAENRGMVFGIFNGRLSSLVKSSLVGFRILLLIGLTVFIWYKRGQSLLYLFPFVLFWAGAAGNIIDHFLYGYVVDFIHIRAGRFLDWPYYFNLADAYVTAGIPAFLLLNKLNPLSAVPAVKSGESSLQL